MKTGHLLYLSGLNRDTYNALRRRGHLPFLEDTAFDAQILDRFTEAHALALVAFSKLVRLGVAASVVAETVKASWPDIKRIVGQGNGELKSRYCGMRENDLGLMDHYGWPHPTDNDEEPVASAHVDLLKLYQWIKPSIDDLVHEPSSDMDEAA